MSCTTLKYFLTTPELHHRSLLDIPSSRRVSLTWSSSSDHPSQRENDFAVLLQNSTLQLLPCPRSRHTWRIFLLAFYLRGSYWTSACGASLSPSSPWGWSSASCCCCRSYCWSSPSPTKSHPTYQTRLFTRIQLELLWTQTESVNLKMNRPPQSTAWADRSSGCHPVCGAQHWGCSESTVAPPPLETLTEDEEKRFIYCIHYYCHWLEKCRSLISRMRQVPCRRSPTNLTRYNI